MRWLVATGLMLAMTSSVHADSEARAILDKAIKNERDKKVLDESLAALDRLLAKTAKDPEAHYARGWVLSRLERPAEAVAEYDQALAIDPKLADAAYNAGVVLGGLKKEKEAVVYFDRALAINPKFVDAAYNAGQGYYNLKDFVHAAERWIAAEKLAPEDFAVARKLVQVHHALHKDAEAAKARPRLRGGDIRYVGGPRLCVSLRRRGQRQEDRERQPGDQRGDPRAGGAVPARDGQGRHPLAAGQDVQDVADLQGAEAAGDRRDQGEVLDAVSTTEHYTTGRGRRHNRRRRRLRGRREETRP
ncbi:MAG: tetratricopeptide repeat protein [Deltaproteobacteria bacterium]|nr:MAG: tetratricopeptide repeat protein [Deltaproteobacteria bacterium]